MPEFFCKEDDWSLYYKLIDEMRESQQKGKAPGSRGPGPEWQSWHEGAHLISKDPSGSKTYQEVQKKMGDFFGLPPQSRGTRFNWYNNPSDWKPFHHDSAAFNAQRARNQNCTVGVSFGDARELAFVDAQDPTKRFYFPQTKVTLLFWKGCHIRFWHRTCCRRTNVPAKGASPSSCGARPPSSTRRARRRTSRTRGRRSPSTARAAAKAVVVAGARPAGAAAGGPPPAAALSPRHYLGFTGASWPPPGRRLHLRRRRCRRCSRALPRVGHVVVEGGRVRATSFPRRILTFERVDAVLGP